MRREAAWSLRVSTVTKSVFSTSPKLGAESTRATRNSCEDWVPLRWRKGATP